MTSKEDTVCYHHYSLKFEPSEISHRFRRVRFVLVAGCVLRAEAQAKYLANHIFDGNKLDEHQVEVLTKPTSRFTLYQVGPVLVSNHGMGSASMSIALHELFLMCQASKIIDLITLIRFGTCGGIGVEPGTVCITTKSMDSLFNEYVELKICMRRVCRDCKVDLTTAKELELLANEHLNDVDSVRQQLGSFKIASGSTIATNDFYEEQGRTNGAICEHSIEDKMNFLERCKQIGAINMEMESNYLAAMCHKLNVKFGIICVALNNRLLDDRVKLNANQVNQFEQRLFWLSGLFISHKLNLSE